MVVAMSDGVILVLFELAWRLHWPWDALLADHGVCFLLAGEEGLCAIVHYRSAATLKAARAWLLKQQARPYDIITSPEKCERCRSFLSFFGLQDSLPTASVVKDALEKLTPDSFRIPEGEARRVLHGTEVLRSSAPDNATLLEHFASLKQALFARTCYDGESGNPFVGLIDRVEMVLPETSGLLHRVIFRDRRGDAELTIRDSCHAVIFVVADVKRHVLQPFTAAIEESEMSTRWIDEFQRWKGASQGQPSTIGVEPNQPFTFPVLQIMLTADKVYFNEREAAINKLRKSRGSLAAKRRIVQSLRQEKDIASLLRHVETALVKASGGALSLQDVQEIVRRQVVVTLNWRKACQELQNLGLEQQLGPTTADVVRGLCQRLKEAQDVVDVVVQQAADQQVAGVASEVESYMQAMWAAASSPRPAQQDMGVMKAAGFR
jgi:hypothetical protein